MNNTETRTLQPVDKDTLCPSKRPFRLTFFFPKGRGPFRLTASQAALPGAPGVASSDSLGAFGAAEAAGGAGAGGRLSAAPGRGASGESFV